MYENKSVFLCGSTYRNADAVNEELLDKLFAEGEEPHPVFRDNGRW